MSDLTKQQEQHGEIARAIVQDLYQTLVKHCPEVRDVAEFFGPTAARIATALDMAAERGRAMELVTDAGPETSPPADETSAPEAEAPAEGANETRQFRDMLPPAPEGCHWEDHGYQAEGEEGGPYYQIVRDSDGQTVGEVYQTWSTNYKWTSVLNDWREREETFEEAAKSLVAHVTKWLALEGERPPHAP